MTGVGLLEQVFVGLWIVMSVLYWLNHRNTENPVGSIVKVGLLLAFVYGVIASARWATAEVPAEHVMTWGIFEAPAEGTDAMRAPGLYYVMMGLAVVVVLLILKHALPKASTVGAVILSTWDRGNWFLLPCLFIMLTLGLLLAAAAASPMLSPFIYTLF